MSNKPSKENKFRICKRESFSKHGFFHWSIFQFKNVLFGEITCSLVYILSLF